MKNPCISCKHRGDVFYLGPTKAGLPHCHCLLDPEFGWGSLREAFWTCKKFKRREKKLKKIVITYKDDKINFQSDFNIADSVALLELMKILLLLKDQKNVPAKNTADNPDNN